MHWSETCTTTLARGARTFAWALCPQSALPAHGRWFDEAGRRGGRGRMRGRAAQGRWLPELQRIVGVISADFARNMRTLHCAGEVRRAGSLEKGLSYSARAPLRRPWGCVPTRRRRGPGRHALAAPCGPLCCGWAHCVDSRPAGATLAPHGSPRRRCMNPEHLRALHWRGPAAAAPPMPPGTQGRRAGKRLNALSALIVDGMRAAARRCASRCRRATTLSGARSRSGSSSATRRRCSG